MNNMIIKEPLQKIYEEIAIKPHSEQDWNIFKDVIYTVAPQRIIESGFFQGGSALAWLYLSDAILTSIDPMHGSDNKIQNVAKLTNLFPQRFIFLEKESRHTRPDLSSGNPIDLFFVDGDHSMSGAIEDFNLALDLNIKWLLVDDWDGDVINAYNQVWRPYGDIIKIYPRSDMHNGNPIHMALCKKRN